MQSSVTMVLGASPNPERYSFMATVMLLEKGHAVYPYGIKKGMIQNLPILQDWPSPGSISSLTLYLGPSAQAEYYDQIIALKPERIIFNPGTENPILVALAHAAQIPTIEACTLVMLKTGQY
ncbi:MAG: CoA-binding protein [Chitinophagia bacterium]